MEVAPQAAGGSSWDPLPGSTRPQELLEMFTGDIHREKLLSGRVETQTEVGMVLRFFPWG